jgi:hypothetical protein
MQLRIGINAISSIAKPFFDRGKAWISQQLRGIFDKSGKTAWFDELLNTQM